jgi:hypothetical protein
MNYFKLIAALLASASIVSTSPYPYPNADGGHQLAGEQLLRLEGLVRVEDSPENLSVILGDCGQIGCTVSIIDILFEMINLNRIDSFKLLLSRVNIDARKTSHLLSYASSVPNFEVCEYLMLRGVKMQSWYNTATGKGVTTIMREFAARHPDKIMNVMPRSSIMRDQEIERVLALLDFIGYCKSISQVLDNEAAYQPSVMLIEVLPNRFLDDAALAVCIARLLEMGAVVDRDSMELFKQNRPDYVESNRRLDEAFNLPDIKEPEQP